MTSTERRPVELRVGGAQLRGTLSVPNPPIGVAVLVSDTSQARFGTLERSLVSLCLQSGLATLVMDLQTPSESADRTARTDLMVDRLSAQFDWLDEQDRIDDLDRFLYGFDAGAAAAVTFLGTTGRSAEALALLNGRMGLVEEVVPDIRLPVLFFVDERHPHLVDTNLATYRTAGTDTADKHFLHAASADSLPTVVRWTRNRDTPVDVGPDFRSRHDERQDV
jgi:alpha-beta hydrolase superfamily lysophospholipase